MKVDDNAVEELENNGSPSENISTDFEESLVKTMEPDTNIRISGIKDSELLVIRAKDNDKSIGRSISSGLISSKVGNWIIVGDSEGVCEFNSSQVIDGKTEVTISRIPIVTVDHTNNKDIRTIKVLDHNGESAGRFPIAGTKYGYFIDEKVLYVDLKDLLFDIFGFLAVHGKRKICLGENKIQFGKNFAVGNQLVDMFRGQST